MRIQGGLGAGELLHPACHQRHRCPGHHHAQEPARRTAAASSALGTPTVPATAGLRLPALRGAFPTDRVLIARRCGGLLLGLSRRSLGVVRAARVLALRAPAHAGFCLLPPPPRALALARGEQTLHQRGSREQNWGCRQPDGIGLLTGTTARGGRCHGGSSFGAWPDKTRCHRLSNPALARSARPYPLANPRAPRTTSLLHSPP